MLFRTKRWRLVSLWRFVGSSAWYENGFLEGVVFPSEILDKREPVQLVGLAGAGESFLAQGLGYAAVRAGHIIRLIHADDFFRALARIG